MCDHFFDPIEEEKKDDFEPLFPGDTPGFREQDSKRWRKTGKSAFWEDGYCPF